MAELKDIPDSEDVALTSGLNAIAGLAKEVYPNHKVMRANADFNIPTTPYITVEPITVNVFPENGLGNKPILVDDTYEDGVRTTQSVYQEACIVRIKVYKENAFIVAKGIKRTMEQDEPHWRWFGKTNGLIGLTSFRPVRSTPTTINFQYIEQCATFDVTLTYIHKVVDTTGGIIAEVKGFINTELNEDEVVISQELDLDFQDMFPPIPTPPSP